MAPTVCPFDGNQDLYGLGIRLGLYLQWATNLLTIFDPANEELLRVVNVTVQFAIFVGLCSVTGSVKPIEPVIVFWLLCGSLSSARGDGMLWFGHFSGLLRFGFYVMLSSYACWYWWVGLDEMLEPGCGAVAFFGEVSVTGGFRVFGKFVAVSGLAVSAAATVWCVRGFFGDRKQERAKGVPPKVEVSLLSMSLALMAVSIAAIEYLVWKNKITGISGLDSVGQLIPFLIGCFGTAGALWKLTKGKGRLLRRKICWYALGRHL